MYQHPGIKKRVKGQRYDKPLLNSDMIAALDNPGASAYFGVPAGFAVKELTAFGGSGQFGEKVEYQRLEVMSPAGIVIPCYRRTGGNYMVCQDYSFKAARP